MRFVAYRSRQGERGLAVRRGGDLVALAGQSDLLALLRAGPEALKAAHDGAARGRPVDPEGVAFLPPLPHPPKIICVGLNYADHTKESPYDQPSYPTLFPRFATTLVGHGQPLIRPICSEQFDYEGEMVAVIGKAGRHVAKENALDHIAGYSVFNEGSVRDYQFKSPQWTVGKNFDGSGAFGPDFVTADELPPGGKGLALTTRLNGAVVQSATTADMLFDVATLIATISEAMTLEPGDVLVTGTPAGVGFARKPQLFMKDGDSVEVEIEGIGLLRNPVRDEAKAASSRAAAAE